MGREDVLLVQVSASALIQPTLWGVPSVEHSPARSVQLTWLQIMVGCARDHPKLWRGHLVYPIRSLYPLPHMLKTKIKDNKT